MKTPLKEDRLDFIIIALKPDPHPKLAEVQKCHFSLQDLPLPQEGESVNIIQHPSKSDFTSFKCSASGTIIHSDDNFLVHYNAPADHGSSGSPVLDSKNHLVGLHRSECPKKDDPHHKSHQLCSTAISIKKIVAHLKSYNKEEPYFIPIMPLRLIVKAFVKNPRRYLSRENFFSLKKEWTLPWKNRWPM